MESILLNIIMIILCIFFIYLNKKNGAATFSIVQIQNYIWLMAFVIYLSNVFEYYEMSVIVYICAFFYLVTFNLVNLGKRYSVIEKFESEDRENIVTSIMDKKKSTRCILFSIIGWGLSFFILRKSIPIIQSYGFVIGLKVLRNSFYDYTIFSTLEHCIVSYVIRPIFTVAIILLAQQISVYKINKKLCIVVVVDVFLLLFMTAGRAMMVNLVMYVIGAIITMNGGYIKNLWRKYKKYIIPAAILLVIMVQISSTRIDRDGGVFSEICIYYFSAMPLFSKLLQCGEIQAFSLLGKALFGFIYDTIALFDVFIGGNMQGASQIVSNIAATAYYVAPEININATVSTLLPFYMDFGVIGTIFGGLAVGWFAKYSEKKVVCKFNSLNYARYLFVLMGIITSIQNYAFGNVTTFVTWIYMSFLLKESRTKEFSAG